MEERTGKSALKMQRQLYAPMLIQPSRETVEQTTIMVTIEAPALSPAVIGFTGISKLFGLAPALGLPCDVPPVLLVTGPLLPPIRRDETAPKTFISWPTPVMPSYLPVFHLKPHWRPKAPPVHCLMAAAVEVLSTGRIFAAVKGATCVVVAYHR
jgi:hypothetical protein